AALRRAGRRRHAAVLGGEAVLTVDPMVRAAHERRSGVIVNVLFYAIFAGLGLLRLGGLTPARGLFLAAFHGCYYLALTSPRVRRLPGESALLGWLYLGGWLNSMIVVALLIFWSGNPASPSWVLYFHFIVLAGNTFPPSLLLSAL